MFRTRYDKILTSATIAATVIAVAVVAQTISTKTPQRRPGSPTRVDAWKEFSTRGHREGPIGASVVIVVFSDFQCPFCERASRYFDTVRERWGTEVAVVYRHFPSHEHSREAAVASSCADEAGHFRSFRQVAFRRLDSLGIFPWSQIAAEAGIVDTSTFVSCMASQRAHQVVTDDSLAGARLGVTGTPTMLLNDLRVRGFVGDSVLDSYVRDEMRRASSPP